MMENGKKDVQIKEARGLWKASSYIHRIADRLSKKNAPIEIKYLLEAHRILFSETNEENIAGKYRQVDPDIQRINGTTLKIPHWSNVPSTMAILDDELKNKTPKLPHPFKEKDYAQIVDLAAKASHKLTCIHPFENGNGRTSRLLINFILLRAGLPEIAIKEDKQKYLQAMSQADKNDFWPLRKLIIEGLINNQDKKLYRQKALLNLNSKKQRSLTLRRDHFD